MTDRTLVASHQRTASGEIEITEITVAGWRIQIDHRDPGVGSFGVCIANVALDGAEAGWCAVAYDATLPAADTRDLVLTGSERE